MRRTGYEAGGRPGYEARGRDLHEKVSSTCTVYSVCNVCNWLQGSGKFCKLVSNYSQ